MPTSVGFYQIQEPPEGGTPKLSIITDCFDRAAGHSGLARRALGFIVGLLADVGVGVLERAREVHGCGVAANVAIDARRIDIEGSVNVLFYAIAGIRHIDSTTNSEGDAKLTRRQ